MKRRNLIKNLLLSGTAVAATPAISFASCNNIMQETKLKGNVRHSVCRWTYDFLSLEELCQLVKSLNFSAIDLIGPKEWNVLKKHKIDSSMCNGAEISLTEGWNNK